MKLKITVLSFILLIGVATSQASSSYGAATAGTSSTTSSGAVMPTNNATDSKDSQKIVQNSSVPANAGIPVIFDSVGFGDTHLSDGLLMDLNGDGRTDIIGYADSNGSKKYINNGDGTWTASQFEASDLSPATMHKYQFPDLNADGLPDMVRFEQISAQNTNTVAYVSLNNGSTFGGSTNWALPGNIPYTYHQAIRFVDMNGDGLADMVISVSLPSGNPYFVQEIYLNTGTGWNRTYHYQQP